MSGTAAAYTYESPISDGCHEAMAMDALRTVRALHELADVAAPLPESDEDARLRGSLSFRMPDDLRDAGALSLAIGVRDNDVKDTSGIDLADIAPLHGDPDAQLEHCLRRPEHDFEEGSELALAECKRFIRDRMLVALHDGLDIEGRPDPNRRTPATVHLPFEGATEVLVPSFYLAAGQALHAIQDSYTHTFRAPMSPDDSASPFELSLAPIHRTRVTVVLNWVEYAEETLDEGRDGPAHMSALDDCKAGDELRVARRTEALWASIDLLRAALDPRLDTWQREVAMNAVLDGYLGFRTGCALDNGWCDAPERSLSSSGCSVLPASAPPSTIGIPLALLLFLRARRRGVRRRVRRTRRRAALASVALAGTAGDSHAAETTSLENDSRRVGFQTDFAGSIDSWALAASLSLRLRVHPHFIVGVDAEWNPWLSIETVRFTPGAFNGYSTLIKRWPVPGAIDLRTTLHFGVSVLLFDVYGADSGSIGPFLGAAPLGVEVPLSEEWTLVIDPLDAALAVPHVTGAPIVYAQYRVSIGCQFMR